MHLRRRRPHYLRRRHPHLGRRWSQIHAHHAPFGMHHRQRLLSWPVDQMYLERRVSMHTSQRGVGDYLRERVQVSSFCTIQ
jgi:hypothetical protein